MGRKHADRWWTTRRAVIAGGVVVAIVAGAAFAVPLLNPADLGSGPYSRGATLASDSLDRDTRLGFGEADGASYDYTSASAFSTDGAQGRVELSEPGTSESAVVNSVSATDVGAAGVVSVGAVPREGAGVYSGFQLRVNGSSYYQAEIRVNADGDLFLAILRVDGATTTQTELGSVLVSRGSVTADSNLHLEFDVAGSDPVNLRARVSDASAPTPRWQIVTTDTSAQRITGDGMMSLWAYLSKDSSAQSVYFDDIAAYALRADTGTTTPAPSPSTPAPTVPLPVVPVPSAAAAGAAAIGSTSYTVPAGALYVAKNGSAKGPGTSGAPFASVQAAVDASAASGTIVIRGGEYHESVTVPIGKRLSIQAAPGEAVWFDGSVPFTGFAKSGSAWTVGGYSAQFDTSPTYTRGKADSTTPGWAFVSATAPMAAAPDQVFLDDVALTQVASLGQVTAGTFYADTAGDRLYLGSDPTGRSVRASSLVKAFTLRGAGSQLLGIGVRRYAPSVPDFGSVTVERPDILVENVAILDSATGGMSVSAANGTVRNVTIARSGLLGMHANYADGLVVSGLLSIDNNAQKFNTSPVSGGLKITRSRDVTISGGEFTGNIGPGIWLDESVYDSTIVRNVTGRNTGSGIKLEISSDALIAGNTVLNNGENGIKVNNTSKVEIWNNTISGNNRNVNITGDSRRASNTSTAGHDPRRPNPDPTMTWIPGPIGITNNVIGSTTGNCSICVEDYSKMLSADQIGVTVRSNVVQTATSRWTVVWSRGAGDPAVYTSWANFISATGQSTGSVVSLSPIGTDGASTSATQALAASVSTPLTQLVAGALGAASGERRLGAR